ncbi:MAG: hypothetical protein AB1757_25095 [Acidobacteriota bacterium]
MKQTLFSLLLLVVLGFHQDPASPKKVELGKEFTIKIGQKVVVKDTQLKIKFTAVSEESRCPEDVTCVWSGNAKVNLDVVFKKKSSAVALNTHLIPKENSFKGYTVKLISLTPTPRSGQPINPAEYEATLIVTNK